MSTLAIKSFLKSPQRNAWIVEGPYEIYIRRGLHIINGKLAECFDIANIDNREVRGTGGFWKLVDEIKSLLETNAAVRKNITYIYVESVLNKRLAKSLPKHGFTELPATTDEQLSFSLGSSNFAMELKL